MDKRDFTNALFDEGKRAGFEDMEVFFQGGKNLDLKVFNKEINHYSISSEEGLSFRGIYHGKMGYAYTEKIDDTSIEMLIQEAIENAEIIDSEDEEEIFQGSETYKTVNNYNDALDQTSARDNIAFTKALEEEALSLDKKVVSVPYCIFGEESSDISLINTKGLDLRNQSNIAYAYVSVMVKEGEDTKTGGKYVVSNDFNRFNAASIAKEAVTEGLSMLGAKSIASDDYQVILRNDVSASILEAFSSIFSAENVQKGLSLLKGKIEERIANSIISLIDNPFMEDGVATRAFDGEGVATRYKKVIDSGILKTYLHNTKTAKKDGVASTGNAQKSSYKAPVSIAPTNMYIEKGVTTYEDMIKTMDRGIVIINAEGLHAGLNPVSGDFSLSAYGYEVKDGRVIRPVNQITMAGNFYDVLKDIDRVGSDLLFTLPSGRGYIGSPSLRIKKLSIAGE